MHTVGHYDCMIYISSSDRSRFYKCAYKINMIWLSRFTKYWSFDRIDYLYEQLSCNTFVVNKNFHSFLNIDRVKGVNDNDQCSRFI